MSVPIDKAIPETPIVRRYRGLGGKGGEAMRLDRARSVSARELADEFLESVELFKHYKNDEPFHPRGEPGLTAGKPKDQVAERFRSQGVLKTTAVGTLRYVDYEIVAARTTGEFSHRKQGATLVRNDFLLRDGATPVVAELKTATDRDDFYALVQLLACGSQLATANQRARLHKIYPALAIEGPIDLVELVEPRPKRSKNRLELDTRAAELTEGLLTDDRIGEFVRRIARVPIAIGSSLTA